MEERLSQGWERAKAAVAEQLEEEPAAPAPEPVAPAEPAPGEPAAEPGAEPEAKPAEPAAPAEEEFKFNLEDTGEPGTPAGFAEAIKTSPEVQKFFDEHPDLKGQVFGALRRDAENREIRAYIPDLETAKTVSGYAQTFQRLDGAFLKAEDPKNVTGFLNEWVKEALIVGDDGKPVVGPDGKYKMHPALTNIFDHIFSNKLSVLKERAKTSGDERLQTALDILTEATSPSSAAPGEVPDELKPFADSLKAKEKDLNERNEALTRQQRESAETARTQAVERLEDKLGKAITGQLETLFNQAQLSELEQEAAFTKVREGIYEKLGTIDATGNWTKGSHPSAWLFQQEYDRLASLLPNPDAEKQLSKLILSYTNEVIGPLASGVTRKAKEGTLTRQTAKQTKVAGQQATSKTEPKGASIAPARAQAQTPKQLREQVIKEYKDAHGGEEPDLNYIHAEMFKRVANAPRPSA